MADDNGLRAMPQAEVDIDEPLVRQLLAEQHPDLNDLPLRLLTNGWDNVIWRLGDELTVRLPRREMGGELVEHEQRWLPTFAARLPLAIPVPVRIGVPTDTYPWRWSVCPWLPGDIAARTPPDDVGDAAAVLGRFLAALHEPAPADAPRSPYRGLPLTTRDDQFRDWIVRLGPTIDAVDVTRRWDAALALPPWDKPLVWVHGDMHPANVIVDDGRVAAVIDFGDLTAGDPATDLAVAWMMFPPDARPTLRAEAGTVDDDTWARAKGWALFFGIAISANSADNPLMAGLGGHILHAVLADG